jgi:hypothetical protein
VVSIDIQTILILILIAFIAGMMVGVSVMRPGRER